MIIFMILFRLVITTDFKILYSTIKVNLLIWKPVSYSQNLLFSKTKPWMASFPVDV